MDTERRGRAHVVWLARPRTARIGGAGGWSKRRGVSFPDRHAAARGSELRRHDERLSLDILVRAAVDRDVDSGRRPAGPFQDRAGIGGRFAIVLGLVGKLSHVESLGPPVDLQLAGMVRLAGFLVEFPQDERH